MISFIVGVLVGTLLVTWLCHSYIHTLIQDIGDSLHARLTSLEDGIHHRLSLAMARATASGSAPVTAAPAAEPPPIVFPPFPDELALWVSFVRNPTSSPGIFRIELELKPCAPDAVQQAFAAGQALNDNLGGIGGLDPNVLLKAVVDRYRSLTAA